MAIIRKIRDSFSRRKEIRKALKTIRHMNDILGKRGSYFTSFAYTSITRVQAIKGVTADEFGALVKQEMQKLQEHYEDYRWARGRYAQYSWL